MSIAKLDRWSLELQEFDISLEFIQSKLNKIANVISRLKNEGLYVEHLDEQPVIKKINLQDRIEEILDIVTNPSNFKRVFNAGQVISVQELLNLNCEGLLVKQINILRNTYQVYILPQRLVHCIIKIFHDNRGYQGISRTIKMMKRRFWFRRM